MKRRLLVGLGMLAVGSVASAGGRGPREASFFFDRENARLLPAIRKGTDTAIDFNGHFSLAYVSCGIACGSYWIVDRRNGGVALVPELWRADEMTWDIHASRTSDVLTVIYGPRDPVGAKCFAQSFRWTGNNSSLAARGQRCAARPRAGAKT